MAEGLVVLDAWPIVEYYQGREPAVSAVAELLGDRSRPRVMSVVNFAEVCSAISVRIGADAAAKRLHAGRASRVGRRPAAAYAPDRQIVDYVTAPLRGAAPRPAGTA